MKTIIELLHSTEAKKELKAACTNSNNPSNKKILDKYLPHLRFASRGVSYGAAESC